MGALFIVGLAVQRLRFAWAATITAAAGLVAAMHMPFLVELPTPIPPKATAFRGDILFMPSNDWNAATPIQATAYNGGLALREFYFDEHGRPARKTPAFRSLFGSTIAVSDYTPEREYIGLALRQGLTVAWTRPMNSDNTDFNRTLQSAINATGAVAHKEPVEYHGRTWIFGRASIPR
jgi:hypothetical protein